MHCTWSITQFPGSAQLTPWLLQISYLKLREPTLQEGWKLIKKFGSQGFTYFNKVKFTRNLRNYSKTRIEKLDGRFVAMATKDLQTLNLQFDQIMFNSLAFTCERNFEVTFGIFSILVTLNTNKCSLKLFRYLSVLKLVIIKNVKTVVS